MPSYDFDGFPQARAGFEDWLATARDAFASDPGGGSGGGGLPRLLDKCDPRGILRDDSTARERFTRGLVAWAELLEGLDDPPTSDETTPGA